MRASLTPRLILPLAALALATAATTGTPLRQAAVRTSAAPEAPAPAVIARAPVDVPKAALDARLRGTVTVRARVNRLGLVDSVRVLAGDSRLREAAATSARWWIFAPPPAPVWTTLSIDVDGRQEADPLTPDVFAIERDALRRGAPWEAITACSGELQRLGQHPRIQNEWAIRDRAIRLARRTPPERLHVPGALMFPCQNARGRQARTLASADHADLVATFDKALLVCPWWADGYQWRAASLLQCGRGIDAMRTLVLFRDAATDTAARSLADRSLAMLAAGDSLGASQLLIREGVQVNLDEDADH